MVFLDEYIHVLKVEKIYAYNQGCTCPILAELSDGRRAVVKYPKNSFEEIVLVNEYIAYNIAEAINLSTPNFGIAHIDESITLASSLIDHSIEQFQGVGFFCEYIPSAFKASLGVLKQVENLDESCKLILFDHVVKNSDRYASNVIVAANKIKAKMFFIDHSHAFGDPNWDKNTLSVNDAASPYIWQENLAFYDMLIRAGAPMGETNFIDETQVFKEMITEDLLNGIIQSIPEEWRKKVGKENLLHVEQYIKSRVQNIDKICEMIARERGI